MNLYAHKMSYCDDPTYDGPYVSGKNRHDCRETEQATWRQKEFNFDTFLQAMHTIFYLSGMSSWVEVMYQGVDATNEYEAPIKDNNRIQALFFVFAIILGGMFTISLVTSVLVTTFTVINEQNGRQQKTKRTLLHMLPLPEKVLHEPDNATRSFWFRIVENELFEYFILTCILLNTWMFILIHWGYECYVYDGVTNI
eukprot:UN30936